MESTLIFLTTHEYIKLSLPAEYPWVIAVAGIVAFEVLLVGFLGPGVLRGKIFN